MIEFLDPRAASGTPIEAYDLGIDVRQGAVDIGLLANGFPDSVRFLDRVEEVLAAQLPAARFHRYDKGDPTSVVPDPMLEAIVAECRAVVAAYGH